MGIDTPHPKLKLNDEKSNINSNKELITNNNNITFYAKIRTEANASGIW